MTGAVAGSASLRQKEKEKKTLTVTVNGVCNLNCNHCYLHDVTRRDGEIISDDLIILISENGDKKTLEGFNNLAIVGMEPLFNEKVIKKVISLIRKSRDNYSGNISLITNGVNLTSSIIDDLKNAGLDYIDISCDGGPKTYESMRKVSFESLNCKIKLLQKKGFEPNILNTIYKANSSTESIRDMLEIKKYTKGQIIFFPYIEMEKRTAQLEDLKVIIDNLVKAGFNETQNVHFLLDDITTKEYGGIHSQQVLNFTKCINPEKLDLATSEKANKFLRVTYNKRMMHGFDSLFENGYKFATFITPKTNLQLIPQKIK